MIEILLRQPPGDVQISMRGNDWTAVGQPAVDGTKAGKTAYFQLLPTLYDLQGKAVSSSRQVPYSMARLVEGLENSGLAVEVLQGSVEDLREVLIPLQPPGDVTA